MTNKSEQAEQLLTTFFPALPENIHNDNPCPCRS